MRSRFCSESESLRRLNLPATPRWRAFVRLRLEVFPTANGNFFDKGDVDELAARIREIPEEVMPTEETSTPTRSNRADGLSDRRGPAVR